MDLKNKKILVTGADGFIGSHLVEQLVRDGCQVRAFVFYNSLNFWGWLDALPKEVIDKIEVFSGDIRDPHLAYKALDGIDVVFHLAALIAIPFSYNSPDSYVDTNIKGTLNILQACQDKNIKRVVVTSTSEVYGTARYIPIDENHPFQGQSPYSASKIGADRIAESFYRSFGTPVVIARPFNTYGPRQSARAVIPTIISQLLNHKKEVKLGSLHPTRDFNFVTDICSGLIALAGCDMAVGREVNIGSGKEVSIGELAELLIKLVGVDAKIVSDEERKRPENSEVERLLCNNGLIKSLTDWQPKVSLQEGLEATIEWFNDVENLKWYKSHLYNI